MAPLPWLKDIHRRTLKDKGHRRSPEEIYTLITSKTWPYKSTPNFYHTRDLAFLSLLYICCGRISEILNLQKSQFEDIGDFILVKNYQVAKTQQYRDDWPLPKGGSLERFTVLCMRHLKNVEDDDVFKFKRQRGYQICSHITGMWPHWFRAQGEAYYMRIVKNPMALAVGLRLVDPKTLMEYVPFEWRDYKKQLLSNP